MAVVVDVCSKSAALTKALSRDFDAYKGQERGPAQVTFFLRVDPKVPFVGKGAVLESVRGQVKFYRLPGKTILETDNSVWLLEHESNVVRGYSAGWHALREMFGVVIESYLSRLLAAKGILRLHSSVLVRDSKGVVVMGPSCSGKTTLALALALSHGGFRLVSDDTAFYDVRTRRVHGYLPDLRVYSDMRSFYEFLSPSTRSSKHVRRGLDGRWVVNPRTVPGITVAETCEPYAILFPTIRWSRTTAARRLVEPASRLSKILPVLMEEDKIQSRGPVERNEKALRFSAACDLADLTECYEVLLGQNLNQATGKLLGILSRP